MPTERMLLCVVGVALLFAGVANAATPAEIEASLKDLKANSAAQDARIAHLESQLKEENFRAACRKELVEILKEMNANGGTHEHNPWLENFTLYGDVRLRYSLEQFDNGTIERNRGRFRLRVGGRKTWLDKQLEVGFRLASGESDDPTSTNQTFDNVFSTKQVWIDLAYAKWQPKALKGFVIIGGKMKNPLVRTNMIWDSDVNPEGVWAQYTCGNLGAIKPFASVGFWSLEYNANASDATLMTYQAGFNWLLARGVKWTFAFTYYDWEEYEDNYQRAGGNPEAGGRLTAEEFDVINMTNKLAWKTCNLPMSFTFDVARNMRNRNSGSCAFAGFFKVGQNKKAKDWSVLYKYAYIEANSTPGGINDSDFGRSNQRGHQVKAVYSFTKYLTAGVAVLFTEQITDDNLSKFTVLADIIWKF